MTCPLCAKNTARYNLQNLCCCVRLVRNSRPFKARQETQLEVIRKTPGAPSRDEILNAMKEAA